MANAGRHNDTQLIKKMIFDEKLIRIEPTDHHIAKQIKFRFNALVMTDTLRNGNYNGRKYVSHSAFRHVDKLLIRINQLRFKHWYFESITGNLFRP